MHVIWNSKSFNKSLLRLTFESVLDVKAQIVFKTKTYITIDIVSESEVVYMSLVNQMVIVISRSSMY